MLLIACVLNTVRVRATTAASRLSQKRLLAGYQDVAIDHPEQQNPVIVIPGILGSRLVHKATSDVVWGGETRAGFCDITDVDQLRPSAARWMMARLRTMAAR